MQTWMGRRFQWSAAVTDLKCNSCLCEYWFLCKLFAESKPERSGTILGTKGCWQLRPESKCVRQFSDGSQGDQSALHWEWTWHGVQLCPPTTQTASQPTSCGHGAKKGSFSHPRHKQVAETFGLCSLLTVRSSRLCCSYFWTVAQFRAEEWGTVPPCKKIPRHAMWWCAMICVPCAGWLDLVSLVMASS